MHPVNMFQKKDLARESIREGFTTRPLKTRKEEPSLDLWIANFWKCVHIMSRTYAPDEVPGMKAAYECFFQSLTGILPSAFMRAFLKDFIAMTPNVRKILLENKSLSSFFTVHPETFEMISQNPKFFFEYSLQDGDKLFIWSFLLHAYFHILTKMPVESLNILKHRFRPESISKDVWANPLWYMIHTCAYYSKEDQRCQLFFKAFMSCLRYALPCSKCRAHLMENLEHFDFDKYCLNTEGLFNYTVDLHNTVNKQLGKPIISVEAAKQIYDPLLNYSDNRKMNVSRFISRGSSLPL
jgi:hypothetical protein